MAVRTTIKIDGKKLDAAIKAAEGDKWNQAKISCYIMNMKKSYYCYAVTNNLMNPEVLDRVCQYYDLDKDDFIVTAEDEKKQIQQQADTQNYENVLTYLKGIDGILRELLSTQKSTNFILNEMKNNLIKSNSNEKDICDLLAAAEKRKQAYHHTASKIRS